METFGSYLKAQREKKGIRLEEIASITKIHLHNLELLEASRWDNLPPEPFIRGFIIAYSKYVGLEPKEVISRFLDETGHKIPSLGDSKDETENSNDDPSNIRTESTSTASIPHSPQPQPQISPSELISHGNRNPILNKRLLLGVGVAAVVAVAIVIMYIGKSNSLSSPNANTSTVETAQAPTDAAKAPETIQPAQPQQTAQTPPPSEPQKFPVISAPSIPEAAPIQTAVGDQVKSATENRTPASTEKEKVKEKNTTAGAESDAAHEIVIESKERTWIKVVIDQKAPIEFFLPKGETATYSAKQKIKVVLGNSTGSKVTHNGEVATGTRFQGTIRSYIFPPEARFPQDQPKRVTTSEKTEETSTNDDDRDEPATSAPAPAPTPATPPTDTQSAAPDTTKQ
jgi:cytoskeleton protein RodZ